MIHASYSVELNDVLSRRIITRGFEQSNAFPHRRPDITWTPHEYNFFPVDYPEMLVPRSETTQNYVIWFIKAYAHIYVQSRALNAFPAKEKTCQINDP